MQIVVRPAWKDEQIYPQISFKNINKTFERLVQRVPKNNLKDMVRWTESQRKERRMNLKVVLAVRRSSCVDHEKW